MLVFAALEIPAVQRQLAPPLPYYAIKREYRPDPVLAFVPAGIGAPYEIAYQLNGDLWTPDYRVDVEPIDMRMSYNQQGFRINSGASRYDAVAIGDSYLEFGETDYNTFTETLALVSGRSIFNMGRGWYGPYQYLELLKRHATKLRPRYVFFMFFSGNDIRDVQEYERWKRSGHYYRQNVRFWEGSARLARNIARVSPAGTSSV